MYLIWQFFYSYFPAHQNKDEVMEQVCYHLAEEKFGSDFTKEKGVISFQEKADYLNDEFQVEHLNSNSKIVNFYMQKNPGYVHGDELACCCNLNRDNFKHGVLSKFTVGRAVEWKFKPDFTKVLRNMV